MEKVYLSRNPTAKSIIEAVSMAEGSPECYAHFTFRTLALRDQGFILKRLDLHKLQCQYSSYSCVYKTTQNQNAKTNISLKLFVKSSSKQEGQQFVPPKTEYSSACSSPLPSFVVAELLVDELSSQSQEIIRKYVKMSANGNKYAVLASTLGCLTWEKPTYADYQQLSRESEYAAWTLVNYTVNHVTISVHRLKSHIGSMESLTRFIHDQGYILNSEGGTLKNERSRSSIDEMVLSWAVPMESWRALRWVKFQGGLHNSTCQHLRCSSYILTSICIGLPEY
ncbi:uncharacterized protein LOC109827360 [Asparagus officinalis]|uniref:uncharacterized protein LOC109827360 n=1 Tax=Asparagus officinalis TaxID=4686 RepID=UPI00098E0979|nr:uncharacterized protein LOC109827360 [Asparagus officinalis]